MGSLRDIRREAHSSFVPKYVPEPEEAVHTPWGMTGPVNVVFGPTGPAGKPYVGPPATPTGPRGAKGSGPVVSGPGWQGSAPSAARANHTHNVVSQPNLPQPWQCHPGTGTCGPECPQNKKECEPSWNYRNRPVPKQGLLNDAYEYLKNAFKLGQVLIPWRK
jgi:hypothetical protein